MALNVGVVEAILRARDEMSPKLKTAGQNLDRFGANATRLGTALTLGLTVPLAAIGIGSAKAAIEFESSFAGVRKTVDATEKQFDELAQGFRDLSREIPVSTTELNNIGEAAGQLGIKTENILGFTRVVADLGATTNLTSDQAATAFARIANITGLAQDDFDKLGSSLVDLGNNFATTEAEIVQFSLRMAGAGELAGLTEADILAIGAAMSSVGVEAQAGGTAVQKVLLGITQAVADGNEDLQVFADTAGMSAQQFATAFREDAAGAFTAFVEGLGEQGDKAFGTLEELGLQDQRLIRSFLSLANAGDLLANTIDTSNRAFEENTALAEEAAKRYGTTASQMTLFFNAVTDLRIEIGEALIPALTTMLEGMKPVVAILKVAAGIFAESSTFTKIMVIGLGAVAAAAGPLLIVVGQLAMGFSGLLGLFAGSGTSTGVMAGGLRAVGVAGKAALVGIGPIVGIIAAVGTGFFLAKRDMDKWIATAKETNKAAREAAKVQAAYQQAVDDASKLTLEQKEALRDLGVANNVAAATSS